VEEGRQVVLGVAQSEGTARGAEGARDLERVADVGEGVAGAGPGLRVGAAVLTVVGLVAGDGLDGRGGVVRGTRGGTGWRDAGTSRRRGPARGAGGRPGRGGRGTRGGRRRAGQGAACRGRGASGGRRARRRRWAGARRRMG